jgi:hypothetical protein
MCTIDALAQLLYITLASLCCREKAALTGKPGPDVLYLQVMPSLDVTLLTSANRNARDHTYAAAEPSQLPRSRSDAVGTLPRLTGLACYPSISCFNFISPSSILCIQQQHHIMLLHPTHCNGTPITCHPIVCAARRHLQPSSSCEQLQVVGQWEPQASCSSYRLRQAGCLPCPCQRGVFHFETQPRPDLRESSKSQQARHRPCRRPRCQGVALRHHCLSPMPGASCCWRRDLGNGR